MRNVYIYLCLLMLMSTRGFGQGTDVIFVVDNSGSIRVEIVDGKSVDEYAQMQESINAIMAQVLECNPLNTVTVVQYIDTAIHIHSDFVHQPIIFNRFYTGGGGNISAAVNRIASVLNGSPGAGITGITNLHRTPGNNLAVYLFTDAMRTSTNDLLTGSQPLATGLNSAFQSYTNFKNNFLAKFIVTNTDTTPATKAASAGIASVGGAYTGAVEAYSNDPDGAGVTPRLFIDTSFLLTAQQIDIVTDYICSIAEPECIAILTLGTPDNVLPGDPQDNRQASDRINASNTISSGEVAVYHAANAIVLTSGFHSQNGSRFRAYIAECDSGYTGRPASAAKLTESEDAKRLVLSPNPAGLVVTVSHGDGLQAVKIISLEGKLMYSGEFSGKEPLLNIDISRFESGIYIVTTITSKGETTSDKLIKH